MKGLLKFITCGSVDDGKSTLIGHILYDAKLLYADQEKALELDSKVGSREGAIRVSRSTSHTVILQQKKEVLSLQIPLDMKSIPEIWQLELPLQTLPSFFSMQHRACLCRQDAMQGSVH